MRRWVRVGLLAVGGLTGCVSLQPKRSPEPMTTAKVGMALSNQEDQELGRRLAEVVKSKRGTVKGAQAQQYVDEVGKQLVAALPRDQQRFAYTFTVLDDPERINSFSLPGGQVFVTSALVEAVSSEAELAAVLAHEIAHGAQGQVQKHAASQYGVPALRQLALGKNPGQVAQIGNEIIAQGYFASYSPEEEQEADSMGLNILAQTGYAASAMASSLRSLANSQSLASHPAPELRAQRLEALVKERGLGGGSAALVGGFERIKAQIKSL